MDRINALRILNEFYVNRLGFCGCGTPEDIMHLIKDILIYFEDKYNKEIEEDSAFNGNILDILNLKDDSDKSNGIHLFILNVLNNADVLEHGTTMRNSWLTPYGREVLEAFRELPDLETLFNIDFSKEF